MNKTKIINVRIDEKTKKQIESSIEKSGQDIKVSAWIRLAIKKYIETYKQ